MSVSRFPFVLLLACTAMAAFAAAPALGAAKPAPATKLVPASTVPQGMYDMCHPSLAPDGCVDHLRVLESEGFELVLFTRATFGTLAEVDAIVEAARAHRMRIIWSLHPFSNEDARIIVNEDGTRSLDGLCPTCADRGELRDAFLRWTQEPSRRALTAGFSLADEPMLTEERYLDDLWERTAELSDAVKQLAPRQPRIINFHFQDATAPVTGEGTAHDFTTLADIITGDIYPIHSAPATNGTEALAGRRVGQAFDALSATAKRLGKRSGAVLQAWSWKADTLDDSDRFPTEREIRTMRQQAEHGHAFHLWYSYQGVFGCEYRRDVTVTKAPCGKASDLLPVDWKPAQRWEAFVDGAMRDEVVAVRSNRGIEAYALPAPLANVDPMAGTTPLYEVVETATGERLFTTDARERDRLLDKRGYRSGGVAGYARTAKAKRWVPFSRYWNPKSERYMLARDGRAKAPWRVDSPLGFLVA